METMVRPTDGSSLTGTDLLSQSQLVQGHAWILRFLGMNFTVFWLFALCCHYFLSTFPAPDSMLSSRFVASSPQTLPFCSWPPSPAGVPPSQPSAAAAQPLPPSPLLLPHPGIPGAGQSLKMLPRSSSVAQHVKDPGLSPQQLRSLLRRGPGTATCCMAKNKKKKIN